MEAFNPIGASIEDTGAVFNSSKKRFSWRLGLDSQEHLVELECSFLTSTRRVSLDGSLIFKGKKALLSSDFQYQFTIGKHILTILNQRNSADLFIDNVSFTSIYSQKIWERFHPSKSSNAKVESIETVEKVNDPRPARFISDEEYNNAVKLNENLETGPKKSLSDILHKNEGKSRNIGNLPKHFLEFEEFKKKNEENLIELDDEQKDKGKNLIQFEEKEKKEEGWIIGEMIRGKDANNEGDAREILGNKEFWLAVGDEKGKIKGNNENLSKRKPEAETGFLEINEGFQKNEPNLLDIQIEPPKKEVFNKNQNNFLVEFEKNQESPKLLRFNSEKLPISLKMLADSEDFLSIEPKVLDSKKEASETNLLFSGDEHNPFGVSSISSTPSANMKSVDSHLMPSTSDLLFPDEKPEKPQILSKTLQTSDFLTIDPGFSNLAPKNSANLLFEQDFSGFPSNTKPVATANIFENPIPTTSTQNPFSASIPTNFKTSSQVNKDFSELFS